MSSVSNAFYAQSGGVTAVINASACGLFSELKKNKKKISKIYAGKNGIIGALNEEIIDISKINKSDLSNLYYTPAGAFGSCRYKLSKDIESSEYIRLIEVFKSHNINYFFYNGGGDSADTCLKISKLAQKYNHKLQAIHIPKTIDNDLPFTDCSPGFGSVAKYISTSVLEATLDLKSMCSSSTKVFILEVMGRHAGWIAAAGQLPFHLYGLPIIVLLPEVNFNQNSFLKKVKLMVEKHGYCSIVASEGIKNKNKFISESGLKDSFGHAQLGGLAPVLSNIVTKNLQFKCHWSVSDYLQRSARHLASQADLDHAFSVGKEAAKYALAGENAVMPGIYRKPSKTYSWTIKKIPLAKVANKEKKLPKSFISKDHYNITKKCVDYLLPLIKGESFPKFIDGLPKYTILSNKIIKKKLNRWDK